MNPLTPIFLTLATAVIIFALGYYSGSRAETTVTPGSGPVAWFGREEAVDQLRALRDELELDGQYGRIEAFLLFDVATYLGLDEAEIQSIVGICWFEVICDPADLDLESEGE